MLIFIYILLVSESGKFAKSKLLSPAHETCTLETQLKCRDNVPNLQVLALAAYLEAIKIMQNIYEACRSQDVRQDIISATLQVAFIRSLV